MDDIDTFKKEDIFDDLNHDRNFANFTWLENQDINKDNIAVPDYQLITQIDFLTTNQQERYDILDILKRFQTSLKAHGFTMCQDSADMIHTLLSMIDSHSENIESFVRYIEHITLILVICFRDPNFDIEFINEFDIMNFLIAQMCDPINIQTNQFYCTSYFYLITTLMSKSDFLLKQALHTIPNEVIAAYTSNSDNDQLVLCYIYLVCRSLKNLPEEYFPQFFNYLETIYSRIPINNVPRNKPTELIFRKYLLALQVFVMSSQKHFRGMPEDVMMKNYQQLLNMLNVQNLQKNLISKILEIFSLISWHPAIVHVNFGIFIKYMQIQETCYFSLKAMLNILESYTEGKIQIHDQLSEAIETTPFIPILVTNLNEGQYNGKKYVIKIFYFLLKNRTLEVTDDLINPDFVLTLARFCDGQKEDIQIYSLKMIYDVVSYALTNAKQNLFASQINMEEIMNLLSDIKDVSDSKDVDIILDKLFALFEQF